MTPARTYAYALLLPVLMILIMPSRASCSPVCLLVASPSHRNYSHPDGIIRLQFSAVIGMAVAVRLTSAEGGSVSTILLPPMVGAEIFHNCFHSSAQINNIYCCMT